MTKYKGNNYNVLLEKVSTELSIYNISDEVGVEQKESVLVLINGWMSYGFTTLSTVFQSY